MFRISLIEVYTLDMHAFPQSILVINCMDMTSYNPEYAHFFSILIQFSFFSSSVEILLHNTVRLHIHMVIIYLQMYADIIARQILLDRPISHNISLNNYCASPPQNVQ